MNSPKNERHTDFCIECRCEREYSLGTKKISKTIRNKTYEFDITVAVCPVCGEEMSPPGLIDRNVREIDRQYREFEGIVSVEDIRKLLRIYKIGNGPASLALGFGEVTIQRYLAGQMPSKACSDVIRNALASPAYMKQCLIVNRGKIGPKPYQKAMAAACSIEDLFSVSEEMLCTISYVFERLEEVTPLMLQKLLYYIQGIHSALSGQFMFPEDCRAWVHGPVYEDVYRLFKEFKFNPIDDDRFAVLEGKSDRLTCRERADAALVLDAFGQYSGKVLEKITHQERPWLEARKFYDCDMRSHEIIEKNTIRDYFRSIHERYGINTVEGLNKYIRDMMDSRS